LQERDTDQECLGESHGCGRNEHEEAGGVVHKKTKRGSRCGIDAMLYVAHTQEVIDAPQPEFQVSGQFHHVR
jgi:hypothetical protein